MENIGLYLTLYSKPYYTKVLKIVKELESLHESKIYIYGSFVYSFIKHSCGPEYIEPYCVDLWLDTDKSVSHLKRVKINDIYFTIVNNKEKPLYELYITTDGLINTTNEESVQTVINDIINEVNSKV
jgi:hypothetical protein